ncbi:RdRP-domain-containing protein [Massarina eburnea CBS 473.64]|uniref:RNA-dependent RNA polymerase n=1 Tax=Massarina eburnea CBS 473.64 TaxID=1395130 RepID=A0A6A6S5R2_9PLEO|nr:RdRP-domain-containing protein [Massarina eburnea CBS 473.64]
MDIFIYNLPHVANHCELRMFLKDKLESLDILAFDIFKKTGFDFATLTVADPGNGQALLNMHGGPKPSVPLFFWRMPLKMKKSNKRGQPDKLKAKILKQKETSTRMERMKKSLGPLMKQGKPIFPFLSLSTGIWSYDHLDKLIFDSKYKDPRQGAITIGKHSLVIYLSAGVHHEHVWHCRIDVPYSIIEHVIPSVGNGIQGILSVTLRTPPKIYQIVSTHDLHLYSGNEPALGNLLPSLERLSLSPGTQDQKKNVKRLNRLCTLAHAHDKVSALCMVYKLVLPDTASAQRLWMRITQVSALQKTHIWKTMVPHIYTSSIEKEFSELEKARSALLSRLHFDIQFQIFALVFEGYLTPKTMSMLLETIRALSKLCGPEKTARAIRSLGYQLPSPGPDVEAKRLSVGYITSMIKENIVIIEHSEATGQDVFAKQGQYDHLFLAYKAIITPTGMLLRGPDWQVSNRVLRKYADKSEYFLRVFFADEDGVPVQHDPRADQDAVYKRFREVLREGITIAGRHFDFLGFSHSSLRNHSAWFMAPFLERFMTPFFEIERWLYAKDIIEDLGDFTHIHCSAKCAARIGQAFSDTIFAVPIPMDAYVVEDEPDIERNGHCFSDGCGTISRELLESVWNSLPPMRRALRPTILQVRFRGAKGVVSLDSRLPGKQLLIRKSMTKYTAGESWRDLEICGAAYNPLRMYLNHQFIKILEDLAVPRENFISVQTEALRELDLCIRHPLNAASLLENSYSGITAKMPLLFTLMHNIGISFQWDRFLTELIEVTAMASLRDMKYRGRIPIQKGYLLYGIMDETNVLKEGEVYISTGFRDKNGKRQRQILKGDRIVVTRSPALHPGDVQVVKAVDVSKSSSLRGLYNCIVFSQQGARDLPSQLGGGDLDGDLFHVIYDERLIPPITYLPSEYTPAKAEDLGRPVQVNDIADFFVGYMTNDRLGMISNKHKIRADIHEEGTLHPDCITLAKLASDAVDFTKSGIPVDMKKVPPGADRNRPDFMGNTPGLIINDAGAIQLSEEKEDDVDDPDHINVLDPDRPTMRYYKSNKILGVLYRNIDEGNFFSSMRNNSQNVQNSYRYGNESLVQKLERYIDRETRIYQWEQHRAFAEELREYYEENMLNIMDSMRAFRGKPLQELEVFSGNILGKKERASTRFIREANNEVRERFNRDVSSITQRIVHGDGLGDEEDEALPRAIACFKIAVETDGWEKYVYLKSWKYVAAAVCLERLVMANLGTLRPL